MIYFPFSLNKKLHVGWQTTFKPFLRVWCENMVPLNPWVDDHVPDQAAHSLEEYPPHTPKRFRLCNSTISWVVDPSVFQPFTDDSSRFCSSIPVESHFFQGQIFRHLQKWSMFDARNPQASQKLERLWPDMLFAGPDPHKFFREAGSNWNWAGDTRVGGRMVVWEIAYLI